MRNNLKVALTICTTGLIALNTGRLDSSNDVALGRDANPHIWGDSSVTRERSRVFVIESGSVGEWDSKVARIRPCYRDKTWLDDIVQLDNRHILCAEYRFVNEYDFFGALLWQKEMPDQVVACQRLNDESTFVATKSKLYKITNNGRLKVMADSKSLITDAAVLPNGSIVYHPQMQGNRILIRLVTEEYVEKVSLVPASD